ncbi:DUF4357 domain-containing protein [Streptomyces axinellae]
MSKVYDKHYYIAQAYTFTHPPPAAGVLAGYSINGVERWNDDGGRSVADVRRAETGETAENR